jgi:hypothetical protein
MTKITTSAPKVDAVTRFKDLRISLVIFDNFFTAVHIRTSITSTGITGVGLQALSS